MGAKEILCEYLNISNKLTIPFQFHGVDLNHQNIAMVLILSNLFTGAITKISLKGHQTLNLAFYYRIHG